jgi:1-acyl-sn-glycerol-3-phosphate acyltransferase
MNILFQLSTLQFAALSAPPSQAAYHSRLTRPRFGTINFLTLLNLTAPAQPPAPVSVASPAPPRVGFAGFFRVCHRAPRVLFFVTGCAVNLAFLALRHPTFAQRAACLQKWAARALPAAGIHPQVRGPRPKNGVIVCNHLSYIDILLIVAATPTLFVSKKEVRTYPIVGQAAVLSGTIFIDRNKSVSRQDVATEMDETLRAGTCLTFFPEGTTTDGSTLLRFRAALFAAPVRLQQPINPAAIRYVLPEGGDPGQLVCYWGDMRLLPHSLRLLTLPRVDAHLQFAEHPFIPTETVNSVDARNVANEARNRVQQLREELGAPPLPEGDPPTSFPA